MKLTETTSGRAPRGRDPDHHLAMATGHTGLCTGQLGGAVGSYRRGSVCVIHTMIYERKE